MNILQSHEISEVSGGALIEQTIGVIAIVLFSAPYKYGQNLCDYCTGWDPITGWNGPAIPADQAAD